MTPSRGFIIPVGKIPPAAKQEQVPPPGSFDYLLEPIVDEPVPGRPGWWRPRKATTETPKNDPPPPTPPERRGGNPNRVHVEIEIVDMRAKRRAKQRSNAWVTWMIIFTVLFGMALFGCAPAHAENWTSYQDSWITRYHGDNGSSALSYQQGFNTILQMTGKDGRTVECRSYRQGWQTITECN